MEAETITSRSNSSSPIPSETKLKEKRKKTPKQRSEVVTRRSAERPNARSKRERSSREPAKSLIGSRGKLRREKEKELEERRSKRAESDPESEVEYDDEETKFEDGKKLPFYSRAETRKGSKMDESYIIDPWDKDESKVPQHIKSLRNFLDRPKSQKEKKREIRNRAPSDSDKRPWMVVLDTRPADMGNFSYFYSSKNESLNNVTERRKSLSKDKARASNRQLHRLRLKDYSEDSSRRIPPKNNRPVESPPLVIPPAYAQLFIREYGMTYPSLQEAGRDIRRRSASKQRDSKSSKARDSKSSSKASATEKSSSSKGSTSSNKSNSRTTGKTNREEEKVTDNESDDGLSSKENKNKDRKPNGVKRRDNETDELSSSKEKDKNRDRKTKTKKSRNDENDESSSSLGSKDEDKNRDRKTKTKKSRDDESDEESSSKEEDENRNRKIVKPHREPEERGRTNTSPRKKPVDDYDYDDDDH